MRDCLFIALIIPFESFSLIDKVCNLVKSADNVTLRRFIVPEIPENPSLLLEKLMFKDTIFVLLDAQVLLNAHPPFLQSEIGSAGCRPG